VNDQPASVVPLVLVDHETVFREGLQALVGPEPDIVVVGQAGTLRTAEELAVEPHVVVTDLELPDAAPDQVVTRLQRHFPDAAIIALTALDDLTTVRRALAAGANGYLLKSAEATDLFAAIRTVTQGGQYLQPSIEIALALRQPDEYTMLMVGGLSPKETEVLRVLALGHTNAEAAELLSVSLRTIETHRAHIQQRLGLQTRAQLVRFALDTGLLQLDGRHPDQTDR
jgi:two-component system, NarL family, response regulator NreC